MKPPWRILLYMPGFFLRKFAPWGGVGAMGGGGTLESHGGVRVWVGIVIASPPTPPPWCQRRRGSGSLKWTFFKGSLPGSAGTRTENRPPRGGGTSAMGRHSQGRQHKAPPRGVVKRKPGVYQSNIRVFPQDDGDDAAFSSCYTHPPPEPSMGRHPPFWELSSGHVLTGCRFA